MSKSSSGGQAIDAPRGSFFLVPPDELVIEVPKDHHLYEIDRTRLEVDEGMVDSILALGVQEPVKVSVEKIRNEKTGEIEKQVVVVDGRRRVFNARVAQSRLPKSEPPILVPVLQVKGDEAKLAEVMISLNELRRSHSIMAKATKAQRMIDRLGGASVHGVNTRVARAFGVTSQTIGWWIGILELAPAVRKAVDEERIAPSAAIKLGELPKEEQVQALEKLLADAPLGKKPTMARAGAHVRGQRTGTETIATPPKTVLRAIVTRDDLREKLDPMVVKVIRWMFGELEPRSIKGLSEALGIVEKETEAKRAAKKARAAKVKPRKAKAGAEPTASPASAAN